MSVAGVEQELWDLLRDIGVSPGARIPSERVLAEALGVSRPTVRIAIGILVGQGLLKQQSRSGTYMAAVDRQSLTEVRQLLEPYTAARAAAHASPDEIKRLRDLVVNAEEVVNDPVEFAKLDLLLHETLAEACGNPILTELIKSLHLRQMESRSTTAVDSRLRRQTLRHLNELVDALSPDPPMSLAGMGGSWSWRGELVGT